MAYPFRKIRPEGTVNFGYTATSLVKSAVTELISMAFRVQVIRRVCRQRNTVVKCSSIVEGR